MAGFFLALRAATLKQERHKKVWNVTAKIPQACCLKAGDFLACLRLNPLAPPPRQAFLSQASQEKSGPQAQGSMTGVGGKSTPVGFEPTRGDPIGLAGRRLNRSAKVSVSA